MALPPVRTQPGLTLALPDMVMHNWARPFTLLNPSSIRHKNLIIPPLYSPPNWQSLYFLPAINPPQNISLILPTTWKVPLFLQPRHAFARANWFNLSKSFLIIPNHRFLASINPQSLLLLLPLFLCFAYSLQKWRRSPVK